MLIIGRIRESQNFDRLKYWIFEDFDCFEVAFKIKENFMIFICER